MFWEVTTVASYLLIGFDHEKAAARAAALAAALAAPAADLCANLSTQVHGGIAITWEHDAHLYFKRAKSTETFLGNSAWHRERLASMLLDGEVA